FRARCAFLSLFFDYSSADPRALHSFPTRRSSDLGETAAGAGQRQLSNHEFFVRLGRRLSAALSEVIEDGFVFRVDMALRPNGKSDRKSTRLNSSHVKISYAVFCLKKKKKRRIICY